MAGEWVTLVTAMIGAVSGITGVVLGILNMWRDIRRDKVRLKVTPQHAIPVGSVEDQGWNFMIEVVNLSEFPVVVADVGFELADGSRATVSPVPGLEPEGMLPKRLEPRNAYSKVFRADRRALPWHKVRCAYARTQCGTIATATSGALRQLIREGISDGG